MRIVGGKHRSRKLVSPPESAATRPIPDRVKEAVCNLLRGHFDGATGVDLFAGTGSMGLEMLSRGASRVLFVERDRRMASVLSRNIETLGESSRAEVFVGDALGPSALARSPRPLKLAFIDPPYPMTLDEAGWMRIRRQASILGRLLVSDGFLVLRTPHPFVRRAERSGSRAAAKAMPLDLEGLEGPETHVYRQTAVHLYAPERAAGSGVPEGAAGGGGAVA